MKSGLPDFQHVEGHSASSSHMTLMVYGIVFSSWLIFAVEDPQSLPLETCLTVMHAIWHFYFFFLSDESRALYTPSSCFPSELHPQTQGYFCNSWNRKDWARPNSPVDGKVWELWCYPHFDNKNGMTLVSCRIRYSGGKKAVPSFHRKFRSCSLERNLS